MAKEITHQSFTVRVPIDLYVQIAEMARKDDNKYLNHKVNELLQLGIARDIDLNERIAKFLRTNILPQESTDNE